MIQWYWLAPALLFGVALGIMIQYWAVNTVARESSLYGVINSKDETILDLLWILGEIAEEVGLEEYVDPRGLDRYHAPDTLDQKAYRICHLINEGMDL